MCGSGSISDTNSIYLEMLGGERERRHQEDEKKTRPQGCHLAAPTGGGKDAPIGLTTSAK